MPVNYIICAAGQGSRFEKLFPGIPKPLIKLNGKYLIDWSLDSLPIFADDTIIFVTQKIHGVKDKVFEHIQNRFAFNRVEWVELDGLTGGQLETALAAKKYYDPKASIVIFNCDTFFQSKSLLSLMNDSSIEGIIPSSKEPGDAWSFSKVDAKDLITEVAEKKRISNWASVGFYYFRDQAKFVKLANKYLKKKPKGETYVAPFYKEYLVEGTKLVIDRVSLFKPMGTVEQIEKYWKIKISNVINENYRKVLVVDVDNTITIDDASSYPEKKPNKKLIAKLREYKAKGYEIILYTARRMKTYKADEAKVIAHISGVTIEWLKKHNVPYDGLKFGKPFAENGFYVDDRAIRPDEFLKYTEEEIKRMTGDSE